ncbi:MAG: alpha/beta hydrolase fold domain-containing protein [Myxococcota bacterium]
MRETARAWAAGLRDRGWIVVSPVAVDSDHTFYGERDSGLGPWLDFVRSTYARGSKMALVGVSNGGIAAFKAASLRPKYFDALVAAPGFTAEPARSLPPTMLVVGEHDPWRSPANATKSTMDALGLEVRLQIISDAGHGLFDHVDTEDVLRWIHGLRR